MFRSRTALSVSAASALLLATPLLTACGSDAHPGAAAVVDGERISVAQLQAQVRVVRDAQRDSPQADQLVANSGRLSKDTLIRMIQYRVIERAGADNGVHVTRREVQKALKDAAEHEGGAARVRALYLQQGIAPGQIDDQVRMDLTRDKLLRKLGPRKVNATFAATSKALRIDVNPRYGSWDDTQGTARLAREPWLHAATEA
ncbi:SurA N-terminal domain-containing protein [Streptomyces sp. P1-3]|uniref:SurA N-terminal domain-containing protein n=1 Tax=Streptomyces sp. P1-3 TaxID=3421658 RepID=UPI003D363DD8